MTKSDAVHDFTQYILPHLDQTDRPAVREAWNNYTDSLHRDGLITDKQVQTWGQPRIVKGGR